MSIETGTGDVTAGFAARPSDEIISAVRSACQRLLPDEGAFVRRFATSLLSLVSRLRELPEEQSRPLAEGLARAVLWSALTDDGPDVIEATFRSIGADHARRGFPVEGYHSAGHALLRAARDTYSSDWTSELSSGWVAFYGWIGPHLQNGAAAGGAQAPAPAGPPAVERTATGAQRVHLPTPSGGVGPGGGPRRPVAVPATGPTTDPATRPVPGPVTGPLPARGSSPDEATGPVVGLVPGRPVPAQPVPGTGQIAVGEPQIGRLVARGRTNAGADGRTDGRGDGQARPEAPPARVPTPPPWEPPRWERTGPARRDPSRLTGAPARPAAGPGPHLTAAPVAGGAPAPVAPRPPDRGWADVAPVPADPDRVTTGSLTEAIADGAGPRSLDEVLDLVRSRFFLGNERALGAVLTRVALRTGADLRAPRPDQRANPAVVANVMAVLQVMGYPVQPAPDALQVVLPGEPSAPADEEQQHWWGRRTGPGKGWRRRPRD